jgi:hypothetical protein
MRQVAEVEEGMMMVRQLSWPILPLSPQVWFRWAIVVDWFASSDISLCANVAKYPSVRMMPAQGVVVLTSHFVDFLTMAPANEQASLYNIVIV